MRVEAGSDFADLFEVKDALKKKGKLLDDVEKGRLVLGYERETFARCDHDLRVGTARRSTRTA